MSIPKHRRTGGAWVALLCSPGLRSNLARLEKGCPQTLAGPFPSSPITPAMAWAWCPPRRVCLPATRKRSPQCGRLFTPVRELPGSFRRELGRKLRGPALFASAFRLERAVERRRERRARLKSRTRKFKSSWRDFFLAHSATVCKRNVTGRDRSLFGYSRCRGLSALRRAMARPAAGYPPPPADRLPFGPTPPSAWWARCGPRPERPVHSRHATQFDTILARTGPPGLGE
jgi:hypothetical protein